MTFDEMIECINKGDFALRSCWNCNSAHNHLKKANYIICCFDCGIFYYKGKPVIEYQKKEGETNDTKINN